VKRRQVLEAKAEAERLHALAYLPRPVKQADGTSMPLCWSGRVHRAFDMANALQRQGDVARLAIVERALVTLQAEAHAAANKAKLAESAYCELCVLAGEQPTFPDVVECPCAGCVGQRAALERLDAVAAYREVAWALLGTTTERPALLDLMAPGHVVAIVRVTGCDLDQRTPWDVPGQYHWRFGDVRALTEPVPCRGAQGLWRLSAEADTAVRGQLRSAVPWGGPVGLP